MVEAVESKLGRGIVTATPPQPVSSDPRSLAQILEAWPPRPMLSDDDATVGDRFGTQEIAERLAPLVRQAEPPFTISISGSWGVGKTTLTKRLSDLLSGKKVPEADKVPVITVDLWTEDLGDLRRTLALEVGAALRDHGGKTPEQALRDEAKDFDEASRSSRVRPEAPRVRVGRLGGAKGLALGAGVAILVGMAAFLISMITVPTGGQQDPIGLRVVLPATVALLVWIVLQSGLVFSLTTDTVSTPPLEEKVALRRRFRELVSLDGDRRVVIVIDNLDRLAGDDAVKALGEIRSFVEVKGSRCVFVVPIDRDALVRHLAKSMNGELQTARDYLDKFFNLDVLLTKPVRQDLRSWTRDDLIAPLFPKAGPEVVSDVAEIVAEAANGSPRATKRIVNGIYARGYLLPLAERTITLTSLAFSEGLIARFPTAVQIALADPRGWLERATALRGMGGGHERVLQLARLAGLTTSDQDIDEAKLNPEDKEMLAGLDALISAPASLPTEGDIRTVLAVRSDRQWADVPSSSEVQQALDNGNAVALGEVLKTLADAKRDETLEVALDAVRADRKNGWRLGVSRKISALSGVVPPGRHRDRLAFEIEEFLSNGGGQSGAGDEDLRQVTSATVDVVFATARTPRRGLVLSKAERALGAKDAKVPARALVDLLSVASVSGDLDWAVRVAPTLEPLSDDDLSPVFERPAAPQVVAALGSKYARDVAAWTAPVGVAEMDTVASRLLQSRRAGWSPAPVADSIAETVTALLPSLDESALPVVSDLVAVLEGCDASSATESLVADLGAWRPDDERAIELALAVPAPAPRHAAVASTFLRAASPGSFAALAGRRRDALRSVGVLVSEVAADRWANNQGADYARLTYETGHPDDEAQFARALTLFADNANYAAALAGAAPNIKDGRFTKPAEMVVADLARRIPMLPGSVLPSLAEPFAAVGSVADTAPVLAALSVRITSCSRDELPSMVAALEAFHDAGVAEASSLAGTIAGHAAALGYLLPRDADRLVPFQGVSRDHLRTAVQGSIAVATTADLFPFPNRLRAHIHSVAMTVAFVERAGKESTGQRTPWLQEATLWDAPKIGELHQQYNDALTSARGGDDTTEDLVRTLRERGSR